MDAAALSSHGRLNLKQLDEIDYVCLSPHKNLGGCEATGVLIFRKAMYDVTKPPSFPGGGTVKFVSDIDDEHIKFDEDPSAREMPGTPNAIGFYRAALAFELQDLIGLN